MTLDDIILAFRMIAQGRPQQEASQKLAEALAVVLASPEERLVMNVQDQVLPAAIEAVPLPSSPPAKRRGRPPKAQ